MATYRIHKTKDYTVISNTHLLDKELSLKTKGLLSLMLSLPDDWKYSSAGLASLSKDGKDSINNALVELEAQGYLKRTQRIAPGGKFDGYEYDIYEKPFPGKPSTGKPLTEKPSTGNPPLQNTNILNTNIQNTKDIYSPADPVFSEIIDYLNEKTGKHYKKDSRKTNTLIKARIREGYSVDDFKKVIDNKVSAWLGDPKMDGFLRPETLFSPKFEGYLNETPKANGNKYLKEKEMEDFIMTLGD